MRSRAPRAPAYGTGRGTGAAGRRAREREATMLTAILCQPGEDARVVEIEKGLEPLQQAVGGYIEELHLGEGVIAFVHEEGLIVGLPWNRQLGPQTYLAGPIIVVGVTESGETRSLRPDEQANVLRLLNVISTRLDHHEAASFEQLESWVGATTFRFFNRDPD